MPLLYRWNEDGGLWGIWEVTETPEELEGIRIMSVGGLIADIDFRIKWCVVLYQVNF